MSITSQSRPSNRWMCMQGILYKMYPSWRPGDRDLCASRLSIFTDTSSCQSRVKADRRTDECVCTEFGYIVNVLKAINWRRQLHSSHHLITALILRCIRKIAETWLSASLCLSVCPPVRPRRTTRLPLDGLSRNLTFSWNPNRGPLKYEARVLAIKPRVSVKRI
jgi:hypothetical protein